MTIAMIGIDLAKNVFQICGMDRNGKVVLQKRLQRNKLLPFVANIPACTVGIEACAGAHHWSRLIGALGHDVKIMSPHFVKPYVKTNKSDFNDAEAICEAVGRPTMRFVAVKSIAQQDIQAIHRIRENLIKSRTALINQIRGLLSEYGIVIPKGINQVRRAIPIILEDFENCLTELFRGILNHRYIALLDFDEQIKYYDQQIQSVFKHTENANRISAVEGIGPITATAFIAAIGDASTFKNGRQVSAWLGLVPRQHSSGNKSKLLGISKRGDRYIRTLLIHGARAVVHAAFKKDDPRSQWINALVARSGSNIAAVAVANKNARIIWSLLTNTQSEYVAA